MSTPQIHGLITEINSLLSRPLGSAAKVSSMELIHQREQLKHLRSRLENLSAQQDSTELEQECNLLISQMRSQQKQIQSDPSKLDIPQNYQATQIISSATPSNWIKETSDMANRITDATLLGINDQITASLQQTIQHSIQQVIQQTVRQTLEQTLTVERALMIGEISANLRSMLETQRRSQLNFELQELEQRRQSLQQEITQLEAERRQQVEQITQEQNSQRVAIAESLQSINSYISDQMKGEINSAFSKTLNDMQLQSPTASKIPNNYQQELIDKVTNQTDRFLLTLDEMFNATFNSLEHDIQGYKSALAEKLEQMEDIEQRGESLLSNLVEQMTDRLEASPSVGLPQTEVLVTEHENTNVEHISNYQELADINSGEYASDEYVDQELIDNLLASATLAEEIPQPNSEEILQIELPKEELTEVDQEYKSSLDSSEQALTKLATVFDLDVDLEVERSIDKESASLPIAPVTYSTHTESEAIPQTPQSLSLDVTAPFTYSSHTESEADPFLPTNSSNVFSITENDDFGDFLKELDPSSYDNTIPSYANTQTKNQDFDPADFDIDAETQIVDYAESLIQIEQINSLTIGSTPTGNDNTTQPEDNGDFLEWLNSQPEATIAKESNTKTNEEGNDFLDWLDHESHSGDLNASVENSTNIIASDLETHQEAIESPSSWLNREISDRSVDIDTIESISLADAPQDLIDIINLDETDSVSNSDESLILLPDTDRNRKDDNNWLDDSLMRDLSADLENLDAGIGVSPLVAANLDQVIRNTPFPNTTSSKAYQSEQFPAIAESANGLTPLTANQNHEIVPELSNWQPQLINELNIETQSLDASEDTLSNIITEIPEIIEDPEALFADSALESDSLGSLVTNLINPEFGEDSEALFLDSFLEGIGTQLGSSSMDEIPEIIEDPEALFADPASYEQGSEQTKNGLANHNNDDTSSADDSGSLFVSSFLEDFGLESNSQIKTDSVNANSNVIEDLESLFTDAPASKTNSNPTSYGLDNVEELLGNPIGIEGLFADLPLDFSSNLSLENGDRFAANDLANSLTTTPALTETGELKVDIADTSTSELNVDIVSGSTQPFLEATNTSQADNDIKVEQDLDELIQGLEVNLEGDLNDILQSLEPSDEFETVLQGFIANDDLSEVLTGLDSSLFDQQFNMQDESTDDFFASIENDKLNQFADYALDDELGDAKLNSNSTSSAMDEGLLVSEEELKLTEFADLEDAQVIDWDEFIESNALSLEQHTNLSAIPSQSESGQDMDAVFFNLAEDETQKYFASQHKSNNSVNEQISFTDVDFFDIDLSSSEDTQALLTPLPPSDTKQVDYKINDTWFLGIDFGDACVRASLVHGNTSQVYPLSFHDGKTYLVSAAFLNTESLGEDPIQSKVSLVSNPELPELSNAEFSASSPEIVSHFKHLLKLGLPYRGISSWQPILQWTESQKITLRWLQAVLKQLLIAIQTSATHANLSDVQAILHNLSGVILGHPLDWSDTYVLSIREAVLKAGLVGQAEQIMVIEESVAPLLSLIHEHKTPQQSTLIVDVGASTTSLSLIKASAHEIKRTDIHCRGFDYAGLGLNQDIVTQLLYPHWRLITNPDRDACNLDHLELPAPSDPDVAKRALLQQYLLTSSVGRQLLNLAEQLKMELSTNLDHDQWSGEVGEQPLIVLRRELESQVLLPFIQRLNRELNILLSNAGVTAEDINEIWQLGGTIQIPTISRWLQQKLPNISDLNMMSSSTVANGLGLAPLYRSLLNVSRQQYSDYFLLQEICRLNLKSAVSLNGLMQQLQNRGVNAKSCRDRILNILQGDLPSGLFPWLEPEQAIILSDPSISSSLFTGRLFELETDGSYQPDLNKFQLLSNYLQALLANMQQTLNEPLLFPEFTIKDRMA